MAELSRQQKIDRLKGYLARIRELNEQANELETQNAAIQEEIDELVENLEMDVALREEGRGAESLLDLDKAQRQLSSLQGRRSDISKRIEDCNAEYAWLEEQVDAINVS